MQRLLAALNLGPAERQAFEEAARQRPRPSGGAATFGRTEEPRSHVPSPSTSFVGRRAELSSVARQLAERACHLLTLIGPGGVGKTRLASKPQPSKSEPLRTACTSLRSHRLNRRDWSHPAIGELLGVTLPGPESASTRLARFLRDKRVMFTLGAAGRVQGKLELAESCYARMLESIRDRHGSAHLNWPELLSGALAALAGIALARGEPAHAARLLGAASCCPDPTPTIFFRVDRQADMTAARSQLRDMAFEAAYTSGEAMDDEQSISLALETISARTSSPTRPRSRRTAQPSSSVPAPTGR